MVKKVFLALCLLLILIPAYILSGEKSSNKKQPIAIGVPVGFWTGNDWRDHSINERISYAMGMIDGILFASAWERGGGKSLAWVNSCTNGMRGDQVQAIIQHELYINPNDWHDSMSLIVFRSLSNACSNAPKLKK
jgi:hypothetical protein